MAADLGDQAWRDLLSRHNAAVRQELARWRGREVSNTGDGFLATFDGPARAIRCAKAISDAMRPLGIEVRCGLHTGEIEIVDSDVAGLAVHIGARIAALAGPGEVLVSRTVKDLVAGAGFQFTARGPHSLKGVPEEWDVYALAWRLGGTERSVVRDSQAEAPHFGIEQSRLLHVAHVPGARDDGQL